VEEREEMRKWFKRLIDRHVEAFPFAGLGWWAMPSVQIRAARGRFVLYLIVVFSKGLQQMAQNQSIPSHERENNPTVAC
jgi:hypothetical protein